MMKMLMTAFLLLGVVVTNGAAEATEVQGNCTSSGQTCNHKPQFNFAATSGWNYDMRITASRQHCSAVRFRVLRTNGVAIGSTTFMDPGAVAVIPLGQGWGNGSNTVQIQAIGTRGGCNTGRLQSWIANVEVYAQ